MINIKLECNLKILILSIRSFGDCIITMELVKYLSSKNNIQIDIFTKNEFKIFFENSNHIKNIYTSVFPVGANAKFSPFSLLKLFVKCISLRKQNYDIVLNNIGDFREQSIGFLLAKKNISIKFSKNHPFNNLIRKGFDFLVDKFIKIPDDIINVYDMQKCIAENILNKKLKLIATTQPKTDKKTIAIHPTASQECKTWDFDKWTKLIDCLHTDKKILIFCAPFEKELIKTSFEKIKNKTTITALNIEMFLQELENIHTLICLDSFALHAAYYKGVKNIIMLNGANDFRIWSPPYAKVIQGVFTCEYFPCYNKPKCQTTDYRFTCIKSIKVNDILKELEKIKND